MSLLLVPDSPSGIFFGADMETIRQQILQTIAEQQPITARSVTDRLGVKHETVKMTISKLFAEGKISREEVKRPLGSKGKTNHYEYKIK